MANVETEAALKLGLRLYYFSQPKLWAWIGRTDLGNETNVQLDGHPCGFEKRVDAVSAVAPLAMNPPAKLALVPA